MNLLQIFERGTLTESERKQNSKQILLFLGIVLASTVLLDFSIILPMVKETGATSLSELASIESTLMFIPAVASLLARVATGERITFSNMMIHFRLRGNKKYYALVWFGLMGICLLGSFLYYLIFPGRFDGNLSAVMELIKAAVEQGEDFGEVSVATLYRYIGLVFLVDIIIGPFGNLVTFFGEEWGFKAYLLPRLYARFKTVPTLILSGLVSGLWYCPLIVIMGYQYGKDYFGAPVLGIVVWLIYSVALHIILSYSTIRTKSCIPAIMGRGVVAAYGSFGVYFYDASHMQNYDVLLGPAVYGLIAMLPMVAVALFILLRLCKNENSVEPLIETVEQEKKVASKGISVTNQKNSANKMTMREKAMLDTQDTDITKDQE